MNSKRSWGKWTSVALLALVSLATMGFTFVDRGGQEAAIWADHAPCVQLELQADLSLMPQDLADRICLDAESSEAVANLGASLVLPSFGPVEDSRVSFEQYSAAVGQTEEIWTERFLARFAWRGDASMERAFVTEEYNQALLFGVGGEARARSYGGDWFDVYGNATGLLELELADPLLASH